MTKQSRKRKTESQDIHPWLDGYLDYPLAEEHDACAIVASVRKGGQATHGNLKRVINALGKMGHRSGDVNGEGDGCGLLTDIPRLIWADILEEVGKPAWLSEDQRFFVGHLMIAKQYEDKFTVIQEDILKQIQQAGADVLISRSGETRPHALGPLAQEQEPFFWQVAGVFSNGPIENIEKRLFTLTCEIEEHSGVHVASLSSHSVVYKVRGAINTLYQYYPELRSPRFMTAITLGHTRYSTNTTTAFERVQPFNYLGHNGEINTIARLREQARMLGMQPVQGGSDSQDVDRLLGTLLHTYDFTLNEAIELIFPPILSEVEKFPDEMRNTYLYYRQAFGPFAQGPAGIIARYANEVVFSVDALGLRPLWFGETDKEYFFSSEKGAYFLENLSKDPQPLSPGEKIAIRSQPNKGVEVLPYVKIQKEVTELAKNRLQGFKATNNESRKTISPGHAHQAKEKIPTALLERHFAAFGWGRADREWTRALAEKGVDPISSLGYDGPLAALTDERQNLADYFKEAVAVVTNPAIDREREKEHFSTQIILGARPELLRESHNRKRQIVLDQPVLLGADQHVPLLEPHDYDVVASEMGTLRFESLASMTGGVAYLDLVSEENEALPQALERIASEAIEAAKAGAYLLVLDDKEAFSETKGWIDPHLGIAVIDRALRLTHIDLPKANDNSDTPPTSINLRRQVGLVLRSGAMRNLHDLIMALGLGVDAIAPYLLFESAVDDSKRELPSEERAARLLKTTQALQAGMEKVTSTMGIHELRGYGRLFASIGLSEEVAITMGIVNFYGSDSRGLTWEALEKDRQARKVVFRDESQSTLSRENRFYPKVWKSAGKIGKGEEDSQIFETKAETLSKRLPVTLRHILDFDFPSEVPQISPSEVDTGITGHDLPFVISSMSFGSQGEVAFRAYAEGAYHLNMICLNGEGGEIKDMMGHYPHNRGQQIASGRFGVDINLINSSNLLEIKIGQGAKPGEGGHLPGRKVSEKVATARNARQGVDLISPSNNHDIYSIEDLAQFIEELKTANPKARVAVKVPVVPGIGIIAVGIAKAGADIINLAGYDGGTGAARMHALKYVGLPAEIGVVEAHRELSRSGLRHRVELWCDGGMRTAADAIKMICLGANRIGFGTLAMVAVGCTICRLCQTDTCHVGIATQIENVQQAETHGLRHFVPRDHASATQGIVSVFSALGQELQTLTARLDATCTQDLVGRTDLLTQISHHDSIDLSEMLLKEEERGLEANVPQTLQFSSGMQLSKLPLKRPRNHLTTMISTLVMESALTGEEKVSFEDDKVTPVDRALGTHLSGAITRYRRDWMWSPGHNGTGGLPEAWHFPIHSSKRRDQGSAHKNGAGKNSKESYQIRETNLRFYSSSVPGNGLGAYAADPMQIVVEGGAQDGVGKGMHGGRLVVMKGINHNGLRVDGSVGKGLAYGAIAGLIIVQGNTDSRAAIRLSGADVVIGGKIQEPLQDHSGYIGSRANVKGFLCEYMTAGRILVLGDPGPWICAGMTGGILYLRLQPDMNFDHEAIRRRIAKGANVTVKPTDTSDEANLTYLINSYARELDSTHQRAEAISIRSLLENWQEDFVKIQPDNIQVDQTLSTE
ncbi:MAG: glutamate synthase [Chloroflexi bacterium]|nr:MAG: glutamate synthase [Chloroflexota bacterium]MBL1193793.1 glutamate synthase [Chloroflexota bacterium]NOH11086.1 glutamate synthase [Chloroflexota bacterium]